MNDITVNGYHLPTLAKLAKNLDSPTHGELAHFLWRFSNSGCVPSSIAAEMLRAAGYKPFEGYPLKRQ